MLIFRALRWFSLCIALLACTQSTAQAQSAGDPKPRSGIGGIVVGAAGLGVSASNLAFIGVCGLLYEDDIYTNTDAAQRACRITSAVFGLGGLVAGILGLTIGIPRRHAYKAWRARQVGLVDDLRIEPTFGARAGGVRLLASF